MRGRAAVLLALVPAVLGLLGAAVALASGRSLRVVVGTPLPVALAVPGLLLTAVVLLALAAARDRRRAVAAAAEAADRAGREEERAAHRRFLLRLDHEMKNPVTALRAALPGVVPDPSALDPAAARAHDTLQQQTARLSTLVAELRKIAELETRPLEREDVDLAQVVEDAVADLRDQAAASGVPRAITVQLPQAPWPLPHVRGDVDLLYLAVYNLLANALKFSPAGSTVEVRGRDDDGVVEIEVADSGTGIPAHELDTVFDELARGEQARGTPGSGLGLALVRVVAERHGGAVDLRSRPGQGTSARLRVPAG
ncbi:sensor histidine kinase KdpD [Cellulomonas sp. PS-H5]|uniref:sensor histidine kinase n=1 Tax=Cellulomonas sp. PS-H5 TaxID=2820400 RepID=UPI001C4E4D8A|nr:ATP-binding protein [Cellulomonas sp. PS-H5]MBW0253485.1 sensor histidine kinase [Cellulomonas sp. PS-H5]